MTSRVGTAPTAPGDLRALLLIARRAALEALRDRATLLMNLFFSLVFPIAMVVWVIRPLAAQASASDQPGALGPLLAIYLMLVGVLPATSAVGIASGQFAGEKEQGSLTPLLASPASNVAIFGGKVLAAVIPGLLFAVVAEVVYVAGLALVVGPTTARALPLALALVVVALVPAFAVFAATVASLISSRVRTFNTAQQIGGVVLVPLYGLLSVLTGKIGSWGAAGLAAAVAGLVVADIALTLVSAATWRREEVLAQQ
ncbi:MAG TPA: ABC transporter permease [Thermomicrobiales bacterium]|nr:ABC transporter permease [Thermomicrobiales bacterium]